MHMAYLRADFSLWAEFIFIFRDYYTELADILAMRPRTLAGNF